MLLSAAYDRRTGIAEHFFNPSRPWQRDSIENTNGLVRLYRTKAPSSRGCR